jgi:hypothetical protein
MEIAGERKLISDVRFIRPGFLCALPTLLAERGDVCREIAL